MRQLCGLAAHCNAQAAAGSIATLAWNPVAWGGADFDALQAGNVKLRSVPACVLFSP